MSLVFEECTVSPLLPLAVFLSFCLMRILHFWAFPFLFVAFLLRGVGVRADLCYSWPNQTSAVEEKGAVKPRSLIHTPCWWLPMWQSKQLWTPTMAVSARRVLFWPHPWHWRRRWRWRGQLTCPALHIPAVNCRFSLASRGVYLFLKLLQQS